MPIEFKAGGSGYTLGVEEELHVVDATTGELVPKIEEIMARLPEELAEYVSYELFQSVLEIKTPPCATVAEAEKILRGPDQDPRSPLAGDFRGAVDPRRNCLARQDRLLGRGLRRFSGRRRHPPF